MRTAKRIHLMPENDLEEKMIKKFNYLKRTPCKYNEKKFNVYVFSESEYKKIKLQQLRDSGSMD